MEYAETALLAAALNGDATEVARRVAEMYPNERDHLTAAMDAIAEEITRYCQLCGEIVAPGEELSVFTRLPNVRSAHNSCGRFIVGSIVDGVVTATRADLLAARAAGRA